MRVRVGGVLEARLINPRRAAEDRQALAQSLGQPPGGIRTCHSNMRQPRQHTGELLRIDVRGGCAVCQCQHDGRQQATGIGEVLDQRQGIFALGVYPGTC